MESNVAKYIAKELAVIGFGIISGALAFGWLQMWLSLNQLGELTLTKDAGVQIEIVLFLLLAANLFYGSFSRAKKMWKHLNKIGA